MWQIISTSKFRYIKNRVIQIRDITMKKKFLAIVLAIIMVVPCTWAQKPTTAQDSINYLIGIITANQMKEIVKTDSIKKFDNKKFVKEFTSAITIDKNSEKSVANTLATGVRTNIDGLKRALDINIDPNAVANAVKQALATDSLPMEGRQAEQEVNKILMRINAERQQKLAEENLTKGEEYLKNLMLTDPKVAKTPNGVGYKQIVAGSGETFTETDEIEVKYTGKHLDGSVFDSSGDRAVTFSPNQVVPGFKEILLMMRPGDTYMAYIPGPMAYGSRGVPQGNIKPNEMLIFEITTLGTKKK